MSDDKPRGKPLTVIELAQLLDVSEQRVRQLTREGMPLFSRGGNGIPNIYSSYYALWWYIEYEQKKKRGAAPTISSNDPGDSKHRINETRAQMVELQLAEKRGDLFHFSDWGPYVKDKMVNYRQSMGTVVENTRDKFGNEAARAVDGWISEALNMMGSGLENIPKEIKDESR